MLIWTEILNSENDVEKLIKKLGFLYAKNKDQAAFMTYQSFETFARPKYISIPDYINEFERLNSKLKMNKMELTSGVSAYQLLKNANITNEKQQLVRATIGELSYENMQKQLKAIHDHSDKAEFNSLPVKVEPAYLAAGEEQSLYGCSGGRYGNNSRFMRGRGFQNRGRFSTNFSSKQVRKKNPLDAFGNTSKCAICQSIFHWARDCPDKLHQQEEVQITLFTSAVQDCYIESFVGETLSCAVLDSGCTQTVCGESWLQCYKDTLSVEELETLVESPSETRFKFGDGKVIKSEKRVVILPILVRTV